MIDRRIKILLLSTLLISTSILAQKVMVQTDSFTSEKHLVSSLGVESPGSFFNPQGVIEMEISAYPRPVPTYHLVVTVYRDDWIFIDPGESLILKIDGKMVPLASKNGSTNFRRVGGIFKIREVAIYDLTYEDLLSIAAAKSVEYRLRGSRGILDYHFEDKALEGFRSLVALIPQKGAPWKIVGNTVVADISDVTDKAKDPIDSTNKFDLATELAKLDKLKKDGLITAEDYEVLKKRAIEKAKE